MSLINIEKTITLDVYDHDTTPSVIKTIQLDTGTRTVFAVIQNSRQDYDIGQNASVSLTVLRPDKTKVQITGQTFVSYTGAGGDTYGAKAELSDVALAVKGNLKAQFKITSGEQELRTEIFAINNGEALDAGDGDWAGDLDGHNLDEMAQDIEDAKAAVSEMETDVSELKSGLSDLKEEVSEIEPGLSEEAIAALLTCFQHVAWTSPDGQTYYNALEDALYEDRIKLESITATYSSVGHTVYPWDALDSLKSYITVTALYSDGSERAISDYSLSGTLTSATSIITVTYLNKTIQINVGVTIDSALMYYVPSGTVLDGSASSGFDTGVKLADTNKAISIVADVTDEELLTRVRTLFLLNDRNPTTAKPSYQINLSSSLSDDKYIKKYGVMVGSQNTNYAGDIANGTHRIRIAIIHTANSNQYQLYFNVDGTVVFNFITSTTYFEANDQSLFIGRRVDGGYQWKGTINILSIFSRALSVSEAKGILGVN